MVHTNRSTMKISSILIIFMALLLFMQVTNARAEEKAAQTVAVLPFEMHAPGSLAYLQEGLRDMLASRLAANGGAKIMEHGKIDAVLQEPGKTLQQEECDALAQAVIDIVQGQLDGVLR